ncbi:hypothetical protein BH09SUM1_BH09SUM1_02030 [soil metagenome]
MVASVIAILALLILPIFRARAEDARVAAVQDELSNLTKALLLVEADAPGGNMTPQLSELDNRENTSATTATATTRDLEPPHIRWFPGPGGIGPGTGGSFQIVTDAEYEASIVPNWRGPYVAQRNTISIEQLGAVFPRLTSQAGNNGPILIPQGAYTNANRASDRYPIDPWGTPYLLFGADETIYNVRAVYSLGPNGVPGNDTSGNPLSFDRRQGVLGTGDDYQFIF